MKEARDAPGEVFYRLTALSGGDVRSFDLAEGEHRVGSSPKSDLHLPQPGVSRQHAMLVAGSGGLVVEDRGSKNGTRVDGHRISRVGVPSGAELRFGPVGFRVEALHQDDALVAIEVEAGKAETRDPSTGGRGGGSIRTGAASSLLVEETEDWSGASHLPAHWLEVVEGFVARLTSSEPAALAFLGESLGARGCWLVEHKDGRPPYVRCLWGAVAEGSGSVDADTGGEPPLNTSAWLSTRVDRRLGLVIEGDFEGRRQSPGLLETLLRLVAGFERKELPAPGTSAGEDGGGGAGDGPRLHWPAGYVQGTSLAMAELYRQMGRLLRGDLPVLITGPTGVGKERVAEILHRSSDRRHGPMIVLNCAALPAELLEAELFGIGRRVATGVDPRPGQFRLAAGGTLFLDEIGEMEPGLQAKLLRAVQDKEIRPVGGAPSRVDVRILAATNADLQAKIRSGAFRQDLYYRLAGYVLEIPPLAACRQDVPALVQCFLNRFAAESGVRPRGISVEALRRLVAHPWPGNVRELEHEIRRLVYLSDDGEVIDSRSLSPEIAGAGANAEEPGSLALIEQMNRLEGKLILRALERAGGVRLRAARLLGISRNGLARRMKRLGIAGLHTTSQAPKSKGRGKDKTSKTSSGRE